MLPPGFIRYYNEKGLRKPYCFECVHFATVSATSWGFCWEYEAYVPLYSGCRDFERRVNSSTPIVDVDEIKMSRRFDVDELPELTSQ